MGDDGGITRLNQTGGSGFVDGGLVFAIGSAYESFLEFGCRDDGGSTPALSISLSAQPATCSASGPFIDSAGPSLQFLLIDAVSPGEFPIGSLLPFHSKAVLWTPESATPRTAFNGSVTVVTLPGCGASGSFSLTFEALDGGPPVELAGGFSADYCIGREVYGFQTAGNP